jgi:hypothetical protein
MKVISFSQQGPRAICILSANGMISNVTLRQHDSLGGTVTYEVCPWFPFEICSFLLCPCLTYELMTHHLFQQLYVYIDVSCVSNVFTPSK